MKTRILALLIPFFPILAYGQSTLNFPRLMQPQDLRTTGFAFVNPLSGAATLTLTLYGEDGSIQASSTQTVPGRGQLARLASELFPTANSGGWIQVITPSSGVQGFWFGGDLVTFADGADAAPQATELMLHVVSPQSEINIANTGMEEVTVLLEVLGLDGFALSTPFPQRIPAKGGLRADVATLFPALEDFSAPSHVRVTCKCTNAAPFAATVIARNGLGTNPSWAVTNGVPTNSTATTLYFPHLVEGPQGAAAWRSNVALTNLSTTSPNDVILTFTSESGALVRTSQLTLPPNGGLRIRARDLFGLPTDFQNGWVRAVSTNRLPLTGYIAYADTTGSAVAVVPPQGDADFNLLFAHIADLAPWLTGIALLNANAEPANIELFAMNPGGTLIGSTRLTLPAGTNMPRLLRELVPQTQTRTSDGGFLFVRSSVPIYGIELFFSRNLQILANVAAGRLPPGITFIPPGQ
jgi:hypothetical protein